MILLLIFAFIAGIVTILSPCILPVLPIILSSSIGGLDTGKSRPIGVVIGFVISFTFFTLFLSSLVRIFGIPADTMRLFSIIVIAGFGVSLLVPQFQALLERLFSKLAAHMPSSQGRKGLGGGLVIGLSIGLLWTPCVGPIIASVISLAITGTVTLDTLLITLSYSLGTAIPMFLIMLGGQNALRRVPWLTRNLVHIQKVFGVLMIITAIGIYLNLDRKFQTIVLDTFPRYGSGLTKLEDNDLIQGQLDGKSGDTGVGKPMYELTNDSRVKAPELIPGGEWFNSGPLTLESLRGKVVLVDFWTYTCINCVRTLPYLSEWNNKYRDQGLVIIGVHSPEFEFEKDASNLSQAIEDFGLTYPIVQDNDFETWRAYENRYWPAKYFIDKDGYVRHTHFGEGEYDESEQVIQELLNELGASDLPDVDNQIYQINSRTPETYLGYGRMSNFASLQKIKKDELTTYTSPSKLKNNQIAYSGEWIVARECANPQKGAELILNFDSKEVYLVARPKEGTSKITVYVDDKLQYFSTDNLDGSVSVTEDRLYEIVNLSSPGRHLLRIRFEDENTEVFAITFG